MRLIPRSKRGSRTPPSSLQYPNSRLGSLVRRPPRQFPTSSVFFLIRHALPGRYSFHHPPSVFEIAVRLTEAVRLNAAAPLRRFRKALLDNDRHLMSPTTIHGRMNLRLRNKRLQIPSGVLAAVCPLMYSGGGWGECFKIAPRSAVRPTPRRLFVPRPVGERGLP
jgi:hypothetical protein